VFCRIGSFNGHKGAVWSAKLNRDATRAATGTSFRHTAGQHLAGHSVAFQGYPSTHCLTPCYPAGSADFTAKLWDAVSGDLLASIDHPHIVRSVDFSHGASRLATGSNDKKLRIFDLSRLGDAPLIVPHPKAVKKVLWRHDDATLYTACEDGAVRQIDATTGAILNELQTRSATGLLDLEVSPDGGKIITGGGKFVTILDTRTFTMLKEHEYPFEVEAASLHPVHGRYYITGGSDVWVHVIDSETGAEISTQKGHHGVIHCLRFALDGATFSSGADDATIRLWKTDDFEVKK
jgi:serine-threonine kinase receptor-associated protein